MRTESEVGARFRRVSSAGRVHNSERHCRELVLLDQLQGSAIAVVQGGFRGSFIFQVESRSHGVDNITG